jgi:hypothetical protein
MKKNMIRLIEKKPLRVGRSLVVLLPSSFVKNNNLTADSRLVLHASGEQFDTLVIEAIKD